MAIDYRSFSSSAGAPGSVSSDKKWWTLKRDELPSAITGVTTFLRENQTRRQHQNLLSARLYGNLPVMGLNGLTASKIAAVQSSVKDRISYNLVQSVTDTLVAKIAKNKPRPLFLTSGGNYKLQRKAKKLDKFVDGMFYENEVHKLMAEVFRDGCIFDGGAVHVYSQHGRVKSERVLGMELLVDEVEAFYGNPRQIHWEKNVDRAMLMDLFPEHKKTLAVCERATPDSIGGYQNISDVVTVRGSWHLRSGPDAKDGLQIITTANDTLMSRSYNKDFFPFAFSRYNPRLFGFWGQSLAEQLQGLQLEINKTLWTIQRSLHLMGSFKILLENSSKIITQHLNNDIGAIINYTGSPPQYITPPALNPELYQHFFTLKQAGYEQAGISQLSATSQKPAGLNSGKALREYNDIESDRFALTGQAYERLALDIGKLFVSTAKDVYEEEGSYKVSYPAKRFVDEIDWSEVDMPDDSYITKMYPVSSLPTDPAGRLQTVQEYVQAGFISPRTARRLLDFPDLEQVEELADSAEDYLHEILEKIIDDGEYTPPEPFDDLQLADELSLEYYSQGKRNGLEEEKLDMLRQFMDQVATLKVAAMPPPPVVPGGAPMPGGPAPQAAPMPAPTSDLIQNTPLPA